MDISLMVLLAENSTGIGGVDRSEMNFVFAKVLLECE